MWESQVRSLIRFWPPGWVRLSDYQTLICRWIMRGFSGHFPPFQLLFLWDLVLAYDSMEVFPHFWRFLHFGFFFFHLSSRSPPNSLHNRDSYFSSSSLKARAHGLDPSTSSKESNQILNHIALFFGSLRMREHYVGKIWTCAVCSHLTKFIFNLCEWCQVILSLKGKLW